MMFYIHILNRPPRQKSNLEASKPTSDLEQGLLIQDHQAEVRKGLQKTIENYHLQRRLFI